MLLRVPWTLNWMVFSTYPLCHCAWEVIFLVAKREAEGILTAETTTSVNGINTDVDHEPCSVSKAILRAVVPEAAVCCCDGTWEGPYQILSVNRHNCHKLERTIWTASFLSRGFGCLYSCQIHRGRVVYVWFIKTDKLVLGAERETDMSN